MTFYPLKPQLLAPGQPAPDDAPQTQFLSDGDTLSNHAAAQAALTAWAAAADPKPPACIAVLQPAATV